jgi:hypothetical protein
MMVNSININKTNSHISPKESLSGDGPSPLKLSLGEM